MKKKFKRYLFAWFFVSEAMYIFSFKLHKCDPALTAIKMWRRGITPRKFDMAHDLIDNYIFSLAVIEQQSKLWKESETADV